LTLKVINNHCVRIEIYSFVPRLVY